MDRCRRKLRRCKKIGWDKLLAEMQNAFTGLRDDIRELNQGYDNTTLKLSRAVRTLGIIVHLQRFEIITLGFANCNTHLSAAVEFFRQILDNDVATADIDIASKFFVLMSHMGPSPWPRPYRKFQIASSDQVSFRFFVSLLVADDIIASTSLAEEPQLYKYHASLLSGGPEHELPVDLGAVMGCQNWVMLQIGEISTLAAWKRRQVQNDFALELISRGTVIENTLKSRLEDIRTSQDDRSKTNLLGYGDEVLSLFRVWQRQPSAPGTQSKLVTRIWAHAALIYLLVTVHGLDPTHLEIRQHVAQVIDLLASKLSTPALLRTVVWPFCVTGCLAEPEQHSFFRGQVEILQPAGLFGTMYKAIEIIESVWQKRATTESLSSLNSDIASCFNTTGEILYLI